MARGGNHGVAQQASGVFCVQYSPIHQQPRHFNQERLRSMSKCQGYCGLENPDSTCYLNAVLQTLFMTKEFREHVKRLDREGVSSDGNFISELKKLFNELETQEKNAVSAVGVTRSLGITNVHKQQDAAEHLHSILKKTPGSSELFKGKTKTTMTWSSCGHEQGNLEDFLSLTISFKHSQDVEDALKAHFDQICGVYLLRCCQRESTGCEKKSEMINFPKLLIIQLRRPEKVSDGYRKNVWEVLIRPQIEVSYHTYELYAIVNHKGTDPSGHYNADTHRGGHYNVDIQCENEIWHRFDDRSVSESDLNSIFINKSSTLRSPYAHLLVYRRRE